MNRPTGSAAGVGSNDVGASVAATDGAAIPATGATGAKGSGDAAPVSGTFSGSDSTWMLLASATVAATDGADIRCKDEALMRAVSELPVGAGAGAGAAVAAVASGFARNGDGPRSKSNGSGSAGEALSSGAATKPSRETVNPGLASCGADVADDTNGIAVSARDSGDGAGATRPAIRSPNLGAGEAAIGAGETDAG